MRKLEQHSIENHSHIAQWAEQLTCIAGSNPAGEHSFFFENQYFLHTRFCKVQLVVALFLGIPSMHRNGTWAKLNAGHLGTRLWWLLMDIYFSSFFTVHWRHRCREKIKNSCGAFLSKPRRQTVVNQLSCQTKPNFFFSFWTFLEHFFSVITIVELLFWCM